MSRRILPALAAIALLFLASCSTTPGVRVQQSSAVVLPVDASLQVTGDDRESVWAAEAALREAGWPVNQGSALRLRIYTTVMTEARARPDPFCDPWGWRPYGWGPRSYWGGFYGSCSPWMDRDWVAYPVRTVTWALEDGRRQLLWYASARDVRPSGPPLVPSRRLAQALGQWQAEL